VDNGVPAMVLNSKYDMGEGTPVQAFTPSGEMKDMQSRFVTAFEWEDLRLENQLALIMDLSHLERNANTAIHGIIGGSTIQSHELLLNYRARQIGLLSLPDNPPNLMEMIAPSLIGEHTVIPFQMAHHFPVIPLKIDGKILNMGLFMGVGVNILNHKHKANFDRQGLLTNETTETLLGLVTDKQVAAYTLGSAVAGLTGDIPLNGMRFAFDTLEAPGTAIDGMLGYEFFSRVTVIIRFNRRELLVTS
jgi:hypothetical protein